MKKCFRLTSLAIALLFGSHASAVQLPDLGEASASVVSPQMEQALGAQSMQELRNSGTWLDDPEVNAYLEGLGRRLLQADPDTAREPFEFFAVPSRELNAFALPGGHVGVNTGLILATQSESELASVLAHEISHVSQHHIARQIAGQAGNQALSIAAMLGALIAAGTGNGQAAMAAMTGVGAAQIQSQINYTREHEQEADRIGFQLLTQAGFDPHAMASFFERLQQATRLADSASIPSYLRTHPLTHERVAEAQDRAFSSTYKQVPDSQEYRLVRALLRSYEGQPREAIASLTTDLQEGHYRDRNALRYGLAAAYLRAQDFAAARQELAGLERDKVQHPMIEALNGQVLSQSGQDTAARQRYEAALKRYPEHLQLVYDYPRLLIKTRDFSSALQFAETHLIQRPQDPELRQIAAEAAAAQGLTLQSHLHQGEYYVAVGDTRSALEQFELALKSPDGDKRERLIVESRVDALRARQKDEPFARRASTKHAERISLPAFTGR
ncbi:M48 family metalloprotease [Zoogloea sp.]|uniref:beta-barrel assembly-enhancing protease n=1 Tax=Zoogloea sp. TaxID=49181 RepID=UPI0035B2893E